MFSSISGRSLKHIGKMATTGETLVVVYKEIPGTNPLNPKALVIFLDSLMDVDRDEVKRIVETGSAQNKENLADEFHHKNYLHFLHQKYANTAMKAVSIDDVIMTPNAKMSIPLRDVINAVRMQNHQTPLGTRTSKDTDAVTATNTQQPPEIVKEWVDFDEPKLELTAEQKKFQADSLILQAQMLEQDAQKLRQQAESLLEMHKPAASSTANITAKTTAKTTNKEKPIHPRQQAKIKKSTTSNASKTAKTSSASKS